MPLDTDEPCPRCGRWISLDARGHIPAHPAELVGAGPCQAAGHAPASVREQMKHEYMPTTPGCALLAPEEI